MRQKNAENENPEEGIGAGTGATEGGRTRPTGVAPVPARANATITDPQVRVIRKRRRLSKEFKRGVVSKVISLRAKGFGAVGSYLRSIGVYYSSVKNWERQISTGTLEKKRGTKGQSREGLQKEIKRIRRQLESTQQKLQQSELIIELQKKISDIAGLSLHKNSERNK